MATFGIDVDQADLGTWVSTNLISTPVYMWRLQWVMLSLAPRHDWWWALWRCAMSMVRDQCFRKTLRFSGGFSWKALHFLRGWDFLWMGHSLQGSSTPLSAFCLFSEVTTSVLLTETGILVLSCLLKYLSNSFECCTGWWSWRPETGVVSHLGFISNEGCEDSEWRKWYQAFLFVLRAMCHPFLLQAKWKFVYYGMDTMWCIKV